VSGGRAALDGCAQARSARGSFHAEAIANAEADEKEENGAEDRLHGGHHFEPPNGVAIAKSKSLRKPKTYSTYSRR